MSVDVGNLSYEVTEDDFKSVFAPIRTPSNEFTFLAIAKPDAQGAWDLQKWIALLKQKVPLNNSMVPNGGDEISR
jgi:hypothetical protein